MPQTVQEFATQLMGEIPGLPFLFARKYINQALDAISRTRLWSWNVNDGIIISPGLLTTGTVDVTNFSNQVQFDSVAQAAIATTSFNPPITQRQFRTMGGPIYNLVGYDSGTGIGTLDRLYIANTATQQEFQIYKCYYGAPSIDGVTPNIDFLRYLTINDPINGYTIADKRLTMDRTALNRRDPMRGAQGQPYYTATYRPGPNLMNVDGSIPRSPTDGMMQYEWWPHPTTAQAYLVQYERQNLTLGPADYLPNQCPPLLLQYKVDEFAYRWAAQNMARIPELKGINWMAMVLEVQAKFKVEMVEAKRNDTEILTTILRPGTAGIMDFFGPIDSNWAQSHGVAGWN